jgi:hypothetical protein
MPNHPPQVCKTPQLEPNLEEESKEELAPKKQKKRMRWGVLRATSTTSPKHINILKSIKNI